LLHQPGTKYAYTTFGYTLLGVAIEGASGSSFVDYLREKDRCAVAILTNLEGGLMLGLESLACRILDVVLE